MYKWTFPTYSEYKYESDSDKLDLKSGGFLSLIYTTATFLPITRTERNNLSRMFLKTKYLSIGQFDQLFLSVRKI